MKFIRARLSEGYTVEDLKYVVDVKCKEWLGTTHEQYLRPETLFNATKFQTYINQEIIPSEDKNEIFISKFMQQGYTRQEAENFINGGALNGAK